MAMECISYFSEPQKFLENAYRILPKGGRIAFCMNIISGKLSVFQRNWVKVAWGFVPGSSDLWLNRLEKAGFETSFEDITDKVLEPMTRICLERIDNDPSVIQNVSKQTLKTSKNGLTKTRNAVLNKELGVWNVCGD